MTAPRGRNLVASDPNATQPAIIPALGSTPRTGNTALDAWLAKVTERLEVREGQRGNHFEQVVTRRDLVNLGLATAGNVRSGRATGITVDGSGAPGAVLLANGTAVAIEAFAASIIDTQLFRDLTTDLRNDTRFEALPKLTRDLLRQEMAPITGLVEATIQRNEQTIADAAESFAQDVVTLRASVARAAAGVRTVRFASASENRATAGVVTQVTARLNGYPVPVANIDATVYATLAALTAAVPAPIISKFYQVDDPAAVPNFLYRWTGSAWVLAGKGTVASATATVEQYMGATADRVKGMAAEYIVKVQAGNKVAGFGLSATEDPTGTSSAAFIILADKFAVVTGSTTIVDPLNPPAANIPFGVDVSGAYVNGTLRVNATGPTLATVAAYRGGLTGYGTSYGIRNAAWDDAYAARVIRNIVMAESLTTQLYYPSTTNVDSSLNRLGDFVTLSNGTPWLETLGTYAAGTTYTQGQIVIDVAGTTAYRCIATTTGNAPPNATYWVVYATVVSRGAWAITTAYAMNDTVTGVNTLGVSTTWIARYAHTSQGTFATERDGGGFAETRYWSGTAWLRPGVVIDGNLLVTQDITGGRNINIAGYAQFEGTHTDALSGQNAAVIANTSRSANNGLIAYSSRIAGSVGVRGFSNGSTGFSTVGVSGSGLYQFDTGVSGRADGSSGVGVLAQATTAGGTALRVAGASATDLAIEITTGKFKWKTYSWAEPNGNGNLVLAADGTWPNIASLVLATGVINPAALGAYQGKLPVTTFNGVAIGFVPVYA